jgi:hypothetical protein
VARKLAYLSGAVRVSTDPNAEAAGPRSHILGVLHGFQRLGRETDRFIVGDLLPARFSREGSERLIRGGGARTYLADIVRLALRPVLPALARRAIGAQVDWAYERFSTMQALGAAFQRRGVPWILETNRILYAESPSDRRTLALEKTAKPMEVRASRRCDALLCTTQALARWTAHLAPGGILQFDDCEDLLGCRRSADEFLAQRPDLQLERLGAPGTAYFVRFVSLC